MESIITGSVLFFMFTGLVAFVWRDTQKRVEKGIAAAMPRELCAERHKALDESLKEMKVDLKEIRKTLAKMNGEEEA